MWQCASQTYRACVDANKQEDQQREAWRVGIKSWILEQKFERHCSWRASELEGGHRSFVADCAGGRRSMPLYLALAELAGRASAVEKVLHCRWAA